MLHRNFAGAALMASLAWVAADAQSGVTYQIVKDATGNVIGALQQTGGSGGLTAQTGALSLICANGTVSPTGSCGSTGTLPVIGYQGVDIAFSGTSTVFLVGPSGLIYRITPTGSTQMPGGAVRVASAKGVPWVINNTNNIFRWSGSAWEQLPGAATDIGGNSSGVVWVIGMNGVPHRWNESIHNWSMGSGSGVSIAVDPAGNPWVVKQEGQISKFDGSQWQLLDGAAKDIGIADNGTAYVVGTNGQIYQRAPGASAWAPQAGSVASTRVAGGASGFVVALAAPTAATLTTNNLTITTPATSLTGGVDPRVGLVFTPGQPLVVTGLASYQPGPLPTGKLLCPIVGTGEKLMRPCDDQFDKQLTNKTNGPATYLGPAKADSCPTDFHDDGDYCGKPASYGRGGGYPWQGSDGVSNPNDSMLARCKANGNPQGCEMDGAIAYPKCKAGFHKVGCCVCSPDCPSGWEDIGVSCHKPNTKGNCQAYGRVAGLGYAFSDPRNGGECWACPVLMHRTMAAVDSKNPLFSSCTAGHDDGIFWQSPQFPDPGIAAFINNSDIVTLAFTDLGYVDAYLAKRAGGDASKKQQLWDQMINAPNDSAELKALIYMAVLTAAQSDPTNLKTKAGQTVQIFEQYIQKRRTFIAQDALGMYNAYLGFNAYKQWQGTKANMLAGGPLGFISAGTGAVIQTPGASLSSTVGVPPDDYVNAAYAAAVPDSRGQAFFKALGDLSATSYNSPSIGTTSVDPTAALQLGLNVATSAKGIHDMFAALGLTKEIAFLAGKAGMGLDMGMSLGGSVLDAVAAVMSIYAQQDAAKQYAQLVGTANQPVSLANIMKSGTDNDKNSLIMWWALATSPYKAADTWGSSPLQNADMCAAYANQCGILKAVLTAARAKTPH